MTDGGADYSFECVGDTGMVTTALQSCCDVIPEILPPMFLCKDDLYVNIDFGFSSFPDSLRDGV